jgi:hypothetical protein
LDNHVNHMILRHCLSHAYLLTCARSPLLAARLLACAIASLAYEMSRMLAAAGVPSQLCVRKYGIRGYLIVMKLSKAEVAGLALQKAHVCAPRLRRASSENAVLLSLQAVKLKE